MLDLATYMERRELSPEEVRRALLERLSCATANTETGDLNALLAQQRVTALFAGSLVEGLGNDRSDIDLYCLMEETGSIPVDFPGTFIITLAGTMIVDVELHEWAAIQARLERLAAHPADAVRDFRETVRFSPGDLKLLHALSIGEPLLLTDAPASGNQVSADLKNLQEAIDRRSLARLIFDRASAYMLSYLTDCLGALEARDKESTEFLLNTLYWQLVGAILSVAGETNPAEKWRPLLLKRLTADEARFNAATFGHPGLATLIEAGPVTPSPGLSGLRERYRHLAAYIHLYLPFGTYLFTHNRPLGDPQFDWAGGPPLNGSRKRLPRLHPELMTRHTPEGIQLSRPGKVSTQLLNLTGFRFLTAFTGDLPDAEAIDRLSRSTGLTPWEVEDQLELLTRFLEQSGYLDLRGPIRSPLPVNQAPHQGIRHVTHTA